MKIETYALKADDSYTIFEFTSEGPKGSIQKLIQFQETIQPNLFNLAFGDKHAPTGKINDLIVSNNGDSEKVLATVISSLYAFFDKHPATFVFAAASSARMRRYRMIINRYHKEIAQDFDLYGQLGEKFYEFEPGKDYLSFLVQQKFNTLHYYENSSGT